MNTEFTSPSRIPIGAPQRHDDMPLNVVFKPNMVVLAGLCLLICVADLHVLRRRKQPSGPLTLQHAALGSLGLLCSLICAVGSLISSREGAWIRWAPALVGSLWVSRTRLNLRSLVLSFTDGNRRPWSVFFDCVTSQSLQIASSTLLTPTCLDLLFSLQQTCPRKCTH